MSGMAPPTPSQCADEGRVDVCVDEVVAAMAVSSLHSAADPSHPKIGRPVGDDNVLDVKRNRRVHWAGGQSDFVCVLNVHFQSWWLRLRAL
jgi:hypothetical protein